MPGLVDTHYQASQYFRAGADQPSFLDYAINTFLPGTAMFANATFAREESFKFVVCTLIVCPLLTLFYQCVSVFAGDFPRWERRTKCLDFHAWWGGLSITLGGSSRVFQ